MGPLLSLLNRTWFRKPVKQSIMEQRKKRALLILPFVFIPLMALVFYALGGGRGVDAEKEVHVGINPSLPEASFESEEQKGKLALYEQQKINPEPQSIIEPAEEKGRELQERTAAIQEQITLLEQQFQQTTPSTLSISAPIDTFPDYPESTALNADIDRLEVLMQGMQGDTLIDPETQQLQEMMQSILDLQHPQRVLNRERERANSLRVDSAFEAIPATVPEKQKVVHGATVRLILMDGMQVQDYQIPKGQEVFGIAHIQHQRLLIEIRHIRLGTSIIPINCTVYGLDGIEGLYAPEAIIQEAGNLGADRALTGVDILNTGQSIGSQLAGAGVEAARQAVSKQLRKIKVRIKAGQPVLLHIKQ